MRDRRLTEVGGWTGIRGSVLLAALALVVASVVGGGCAGGELAEERGRLFQQSVKASNQGDPVLAMVAAHEYLSDATVDDPRYDRALLLQARSAERLGFSYAASLWYLDVARSRRDVALVDEAVAGLERIADEYPYDRKTILEGFLASADISGLAPEQRGFVAYHQGVDSLRRGREAWAMESFEKIPEESPYRKRARYVLAVRHVADYDLEASVERLEALLEEDLPGDLRVDVRRTLARTAFERKNYEKALSHYREIKDRAADEPRLLLEMAWNHYYLGHYRRALGLLVALDAPVYRDLIAPKRYLLEAMALREICQYGPARKAAARLEKRHGDALEDLHAGVPLHESEAVRRGAGLRTGGRAVAEFRDRVEREASKVDELADDLGDDFGAGLVKRMRSIYDQGVREARRREREALADVEAQLAQELLASEEGVRLILHELGVSLLRGGLAGGPEARASRAKVEREADVRYRFDGEFWTDELDDLVVQLEDRCVE